MSTGSSLWPDDAPEGQCWKCPDCGNLSSLGGNAGFHRDTQKHGEPFLVAQPKPVSLPSILETTLREAIKNAGKGSMNGKPTWHVRWDDVEKLNKLLSPPPPTVLPI